MIKFYDLNKQDKSINSNIYKNILKVIKNKNFINGKEINQFENKFSKLIGSKYSLGCSNGTDSLTLALKVLNLPTDSEVIIPGMTYISTCFAVLNAGLRPILADIDYKTGLMDLNLLRKKINKKTKVILPVHLYGNVLDIIKLKKIINKKIYIIEDASQAHGALYENNIRVGSLSHISCFSLYPGKNLGAYGDAGVISTNIKTFNIKLKKMINLGLRINSKFDHDIIGQNNRMDTIQAAILNAKINFLDKNNNLRRKIASFYENKINNNKIELINYTKGAVYHQFIVLAKNRKKFQQFLTRYNIQTSIHYPRSINQHKSLKKIFQKTKVPNSEKFAKNCVSIPIDPFLTYKEIKKIVNAINLY